MSSRTVSFLNHTVTSRFSKTRKASADFKAISEPFDVQHLDKAQSSGAVTINWQQSDRGPSGGRNDRPQAWRDLIWPAGVGAVAGRTTDKENAVSLSVSRIYRALLRHGAVASSMTALCATVSNQALRSENCGEQTCFSRSRQAGG
jgi:hypothetical protein